jgi:lysophospholipase L1-like esterase
MLRCFPRAFALVLLVSAAMAAQPLKIVLVGDSTVNDEGGWGPGLRAALTPDVEVLNLAVNGRSSKSFRDEGRWAPALAAKPDYLLIQFGHNDVPGKGPDRETEVHTTFRANMARYVNEARAAGAQPVLVTSIVRRFFTETGKIKPDSLEPYVEEVRSLATELKVPLIDLYALTVKQAEALGPARAEEIEARTKDGAPDHTHLGPKGQAEIGAMVARELAKLAPGVKGKLRQ